MLRVKDAGDRRTLGRRGPRRATSEPHPTGPLPNLVQMKIASWRGSEWEWEWWSGSGGVGVEWSGVEGGVSGSGSGGE